MKLKEKRATHFVAEMEAWEEYWQDKDPEGYAKRERIDYHEFNLQRALRSLRKEWGREPLDAFIRDFLDREEERSRVSKSSP